MFENEKDIIDKIEKSGAFQDSMRDSNKHYHQLTSDILNGMVDWVRVVDSNCNVIYSNRAMSDSVGNDAIGKKCYAIFDRKGPCRRCVTATTIATGELSEKEEQIGDRHFSMKSSPVKDKNGDIYAVVEVLRDITRERKLEKQIIVKNEKMSRDISLARKIQGKILPKPGIYTDLEFEYIYRPSEMLSGDIFDIFDIDDEHIGFYIADVVGHGVAASIMTMFIKQTLASVANEYMSPSEAISYLHQNFADLNLEIENYFTIFYCVLNKKTKELKYVNGGHNSIPILAKESRIVKLEVAGFPIMSLFSNEDYIEKSINLKKDDVIILCTDGLIEAKNKDNELYGYERLEDIINKNLKLKSNIIDEIRKDVDDFRYKELEDDFTLLQIKIL